MGNLYNFTLKTPNHPLNGVFHKGGYKVASDMATLICIKAEYPEALEGRVIGKDGSEIEGCYPKYNDLLRPYVRPETHLIDRKAFKAFWSAYKKRRPKGFVFVRLGCAYFNIEVFAKFMRMTKMVKADTITIESGKRNVAAIAESKNGYALIMPLRGEPDGLFTIHDLSNPIKQ